MRNKILIVALVVVGLASVAYASFAQTLTISGTGTAAGSWDVKVTDVQLDTANSEGASDAVAPSVGDGTSVTFNTDLAYPGAYATYKVTVTNNGTIPAVLSTLTTSPVDPNAAAPTYITYSHSGVTAGTTTLAPGATNTMTVVVTWDSSSAPTTSGANKSVTYTLNYSQDA